MNKKICGGALALGGLLSLIGGIVCMVNSMSVKMLFDSAFNATVGTSIFARIAAIITFVAAIGLLAVVFRTPGSKKGAAVTGGIFAVIGFIGQILINPLTSSDSLAGALFDYNDGSAAGSSVIGMLMIIIAGIATLICGIVNLASKERT